MAAITITEERASGHVAAEPDADAGNAIVVEGVSKTYPFPFKRLRRVLKRRCLRPIEALQDISFTVREGEIFGLIGPNGAGKTTLTKIIATLVQPTAGTVAVSGYDSVYDEDQVRVRVGLAAAEERSFYWRLTVRQNLMFFARLYGMGDRVGADRIAELLALFEMEEYAGRRFGELSTGNKQRIAVMRALISRPSVILLDEPTRSLDPIAAATLRSIIRSLVRHETPTTVFLTSHNLSEIEELCSRVAVLSRGRIQALDTPKALKLVDRPTERVHLNVRGISSEQTRELLSHQLEDFQVTAEGVETVLSFTRVEKDDQLDSALRALHEHGATVRAIDVERATLLDVIKGYSGDSPRQEGRKSRCSGRKS